MRYLSVALIALLATACSSSDEAEVPAEKPLSSYASHQEAEAHVPEELKIDYNLLLQCRLDDAYLDGKQLEVNAKLVEDLVNIVKQNRNAGAECMKKHRARPDYR